MLGILKSIFSAINLYLMRRDQYKNLKLRRYFRSKFDIDVGLYSYGCFDRWRMPGPMRVGRYCSFASTVRSALQNHPIDGLTTHPVLYETRHGVVAQGLGPTPPLVVEDDVWVGHNVMILPGCKFIGRGAVIGAGSVVTKDVEPYAIVAGNPARKLRSRFSPDLIEALEQSRWWLQDDHGLAEIVRKSPDTIFHPTADTIRAWTADQAMRR